MANRVRPLNLIDFTGGLNLRGDSFAMSESESPALLNVDLDPRGGFQSRKSWEQWGNSFGTLAAVRSMFVHELSDGTTVYYMAGDVGDGTGQILRSTNAGVSWAELQASGTDVLCEASPHFADYATWGDTLYIACGRSDQSVKVAAGTATRMTQAEAGTWTEYAAPSSGRMPHAELIASHAGYIFVANTEEGGTNYRSRLRWSHPNNPEAWQQDDYIDILEAGGPITALVPMRDHLLIFKTNSVWALFGYNSDSWQVVNVAREIGAVHRMAVARSESAVYFYCAGQGVFSIEEGNAPVSVSESIRGIWQSSRYASTLDDEHVFLGWVGQRLWCSLPYNTLVDVTPSYASTAFVFDPYVGDGAWTAYVGADGAAVGPFCQSGYAGAGHDSLAVAVTSNTVYKLESNDGAKDYVVGEGLLGFKSYFTTAWQHAGMPTLKKAWRRPDLVMRQKASAYQVTLTSWRDYDEANISRTKVVNAATTGGGAVYGDGTEYGDGTLYGPGPKGSTIEKAGSLGSAKAVQVRVTGPVGQPWGVDAIILKFIPRRFK